MRSSIRLNVLLSLVVADLVILPLCGFSAGEEQPERLGGLSYNDAYDQSTAEIAVLVRDGDGNPVTELTRESFRLFEDGTEVPISHFTALNETMLDQREILPGDVASEEGSTSTEVKHPIYVVLYIDNLNLHLADRNRLLVDLQEFIKDGLSNRVQIMVVSNNEEVEVIQSFTNKSLAVIEALRKVRMSEAALDDRMKVHDKVQSAVRRAQKMQHHTAAAQNQERSALYSDIRDYIDEETIAVENSLSAIREVLMAMAGLNGRKYIIYVSNGLPLAPGADLLHQYAGTKSQTGSISQTFKHNKRRQYTAMAAVANAQGITIHTINASGSRAGETKFGDSDSKTSASGKIIARDNLQLPLRLFSSETGGLAVFNTDDFPAAFNRIRSALLAFYSIGYDLGSGGSDTVHKIKIELDTSEDYELSYSRTLVKKSLQSKIQNRVTTGLFFDVDENPLGLEIATGEHIRATEDRWQLPVEISLPAKALAMIREGDEYVGHAAHFIALRSLEGRNTEMQRQEHTFRLSAEEYDQYKDDSFPIYIRLLVGKGDHEIVVGVLDEVTHQTSIKKLRTKGPEAY